MLGNLFNSIKKDPNIAGRIILVLAIIGVLVFAILLSGPKPSDYDVLPNSITSTPLPANFVISPVVSNSEKNSEYQTTYGLIVGAIAVLLIIEIGTIIELSRNKLN
jgi:hypothetical protein